MEYTYKTTTDVNKYKLTHYRHCEVYKLYNDVIVELQHVEEEEPTIYKAVGSLIAIQLPNGDIALVVNDKHLGVHFTIVNSKYQPYNQQLITLRNMYKETTTRTVESTTISKDVITYIIMDMWLEAYHASKLYISVIDKPSQATINYENKFFGTYYVSSYKIYLELVELIGHDVHTELANKDAKYKAHKRKLYLDINNKLIDYTTHGISGCKIPTTDYIPSEIIVDDIDMSDNELYKLSEL